MSSAVRQRLAAGPARGLGQATDVAAEVVSGETDAAELVNALLDPEPWVAIRAANALKKVQEARPDLVAPFSRKIVQAAAACTELRASWNIANVVSNLPLKGAQRELAIDLMFEALRSPSGILRTIAMQGLFNFSAEDAALRRRVRPIVEELAANGTAAMRARARMLLKQMR